MNNTNNERYPKSIRLTKQFEFDRVHSSSHFAADETLVIKAISNNSQFTRLGLSVSRKVGNAVVRNRWKRSIRDVFRRQRQNMQTGLDIVVRPRKGAECNYDRIANSIPKLLNRLSESIKRDQKRTDRKA